MSSSIERIGRCVFDRRPFLLNERRIEMRITKGQLRRIIAEEHALVNRTKRSRTSSKRISVKSKQLREAKRADLLLEAKAKILAEEMIEEGWFGDMISGLGKVGDKASEKAKAGYEKVQSATTDAWNATKTAYQQGVKDNQDKEKKAAEDKAFNHAVDEANKGYKEYLQSIIKILLNGGYEEGEAQAKAGQLALAWSNAGAPG